MKYEKLEARDPDFYKRVIDSVDIVETIRKYIPLEGGNGSYLEGKCPFDEKCGKSFTVSPERKIFYCFGCHTRGDVISFIAKIGGNMNKATAARFLENLQKSKGWSTNGPKEETKE